MIGTIFLILLFVLYPIAAVSVLWWGWKNRHAEMRTVGEVFLCLTFAFFPFGNMFAACALWEEKFEPFWERITDIFEYRINWK